MARRQRRHGHGLSRRAATRSPRRTFVILCEGTVTEPQYLDALKRLREVREVASVKIEVDKDRSGAVPLTLVEAAVEVKRGNDEIDEVWCLFDVEAPEPHPNLAQALARARDNGIKTAGSRQRCLTLASRSGLCCTSPSTAPGSPLMRQAGCGRGTTAARARRSMASSTCRCEKPQHGTPVI